MQNQKLIIYTDGGARGNPGPAGIGAIIYDEGENILAELSEYIGIATNNQAEYRAVILALKKAIELQASEIDFYLDSELVVKQLNGEYRVRNKDLMPIFLEIKNYLKNFSQVSFSHVRRELNKEADRLANEAMDRER